MTTLVGSVAELHIRVVCLLGRGNSLLDALIVYAEQLLQFTTRAQVIE